MNTPGRVRACPGFPRLQAPARVLAMYGQKHLKGPYAWENAADFFKSDPVKVNCAPPPKPSKKRKYEPKVIFDQSGRRDLSDHTTASTDIDKKEVTSELTMTDVDRRLAAFGVVKKAQSLDKLKEQIAKKKAMEAGKTPDIKERDMRKMKSDESKEQPHKERPKNDKIGPKKDRKSDTAENLMKERNEGKISKEIGEKRNLDGKKKIEKGMTNVMDRDSTQIPSSSGEKIEEDKKEEKEERRKTIGSKDKVEEKRKPEERQELRRNNGSKAKTDKDEEKSKQEEEMKTDFIKEYVENKEGKCKERERKMISGSHEKAEDAQKIKAKEERKITTGSVEKKENDEEKRNQKEKIGDTKVVNKELEGDTKSEEPQKARSKKLGQYEENGEAMKAKSNESVNNKMKSCESAAAKESQSKQAGSIIHSTATSTLTLK
ncbi:hypothetical protein Y032_0860g2730 [Ancylostoma ceylanicum]|uniref:Uncharacterized protein n=2 Tax=Ancylostoma ceylanicum TaxID=53326 RepID=A0A016WCK7_9BILA|nr:hypothetical protein Y032_0860g2730 [Ancylostoma ceylanicum]